MDLYFLEEKTVDKEVLDLLIRFIKERYLVKLNKEYYKIPFPWTQWKELSENRFTNLKREHDRESKLFLESTLLNSDFTVEEKILNSFVFRAYNKHKTFSFLGFPRKRNLIDEEELVFLRSKLDECKPEFPPYTNAFMVSGLSKSWKFNSKNLKEKSFLRFVNLWNYLITENIDHQILESKTAEEVGKKCYVKGFGHFLAYQVFLDLTYIPEFPFSEQDWVVSGPGCTKGLKHLFLGKEKPEELLYWLRDNGDRILKENGIDLKDLMIDLPPEERVLTLANWENIFCEISKMIAITYGKKSSKKRKYIFCKEENLF